MSSQYLAVHVGYSAWLIMTIRLQEQIEVPDHLLNVKYMKFSDIYKLIEENFPSESISTVEASRIIRKAFPNSQSRHYGSGNRVFGIQLKVPTLSSPSPTFTTSLPTFSTISFAPPLLATSQSLQHELELERQKNVQLVAKVKDLEATIRQQDQQLASMTESLSTSLVHQANQVVQHATQQICHGPDTIEHFNAFSVDEVMRELQSHAPDVYQLFQTLGNTQRNRKSGQSIYTPEELKALMSACILLNARSNRVKGLQLLMSIMLVARSTSKQVSTEIK